jgi:hypothetical protein
MTFDEVAEAWLAHRVNVPKKRGRRPACRIMSEFGGRDAASITARDVARWLNELDRDRALTPRAADCRSVAKGSVSPRRIRRVSRFLKGDNLVSVGAVYCKAVVERERAAMPDGIDLLVARCRCAVACGLRPAFTCSSASGQGASVSVRCRACRTSQRIGGSCEVLSVGVPTSGASSFTGGLPRISAQQSIIMCTPLMSATSGGR